MKLAGLRLYRYRVLLSEPLSVKGSELRHREGVLVEAAGEGGVTGWGEAAPLPGFSEEGPDDVIRQLRSRSDALANHTITVDMLDPGALMTSELDAAALVPSGRFGLELALWNLLASESGEALPWLLGPHPRSTVTTSALLSSPDHAVEEAREARAAGYQAVKLKVGAQGVEEVVELVRVVREALGDAAALRLDANQAWSLEEGERFARGVADLTLDYVEEPLADPALLPAFARDHELPVALDESLAGMEPEALMEHGYARAFVLKPTLLGGISRTLLFARAASRLGVRPVLSSAYETGIGTAALVALAAVVGDEEMPAGLDTYRRLTEDVLRPRLPLSAPRVDVMALFEERREVGHHLLAPVG